MRIRTVLLFALLAAPLLAQEPPKEAPKPRLQSEVPVDVDFAGGTLADLVAALNASAGKELNVVVSPEAAELKVSGIRVRAVPLVQILVIASTMNRQIDATSKGDVIVVVKKGGGMTPFGVGRTRTVRAFNIAQHLERYKVEDVVTAVETVCEMLASEGKGEVKYHAETKLLIAAGTSEEIDAIDQTLGQLLMGGPKQAEPTPAPPEEK